MTEHHDLVLRIERTFHAPVERVFDAWTEAEVLRRWLHAGPNWDTPVAEVDLRVGGQISIVMRDPGGAEHGARGEYQLIDRPRRLVFSWTFVDDDPGNHQLIELEFSEREGVTTVVMTNSAIGTDERRSSQERGWRACLDNLERVLDGS